MNRKSRLRRDLAGMRDGAQATLDDVVMDVVVQLRDELYLSSRDVFPLLMQKVRSALDEEEVSARLSAFALGGVQAVHELIDVRLPGLWGWFPFEYARLRGPENNYTMLKYGAQFKGNVWYLVSKEVGKACVEANHLRHAFDLSVDRPEGHVSVLRERSTVEALRR